MNYHIADNGKEIGCFSENELRERWVSGSIRSSALVWTEGMPDWKRVDEVFSGTNPPPLPSSSPVKTVSKHIPSKKMRVPVLVALSAIIGIAIYYYNINDSNSQYELGISFFEGNGRPQNYEKAVKHLILSANKGDARACQKLGICYYEGKGVIKDYIKAVYWFRMSVDKNGAPELLVGGGWADFYG